MRRGPASESCSCLPRPTIPLDLGGRRAPESLEIERRHRPPPLRRSERRLRPRHPHLDALLRQANEADRGSGAGRRQARDDRVHARGRRRRAPRSHARDRPVLLRSARGRAPSARAHCRARRAEGRSPFPRRGPRTCPLPNSRERACSRRAKSTRLLQAYGIPAAREATAATPRRQPRRPGASGSPSCSRRGHPTSRTRATWGGAARPLVAGRDGDRGSRDGGGAQRARRPGRASRIRDQETARARPKSSWARGGIRSSARWCWSASAGSRWRSSGTWLLPRRR